MIHCKFQPLVFKIILRFFFQHFHHTKLWGHTFDLAVKRSQSIVEQPFERTLSPRCYVPRFSLKAFLVREKNTLKCFTIYGHGGPPSSMVQNRLNKFIIFLLQNAPCESFCKIGHIVSEKKTFKGYAILDMYIAHGQGQITTGNIIWIVTKRIGYFDHTL